MNTVAKSEPASQRRSARLLVSLSSSMMRGGDDAWAMAEISAVPRTETLAQPQRMPLAANGRPVAVSLTPGSYIVRLYLPTGEVRAERAQVSEGRAVEVAFEHGERGGGLTTRSETKPRPAVAGSGTAPDGGRRTSSRDSRASRLVPSRSDKSHLTRTTASSSANNAARPEGWYWIVAADPDRPLPGQSLGQQELVRWWTGNPVRGAQSLRLELEGGHLRPQPAATFPDLGERSRAFAAVRDPSGNEYYAVYPAPWRSTSNARFGQIFGASLQIEATASARTLSSDPSSPRWRCSPMVDEEAAMSLLGFMHSGQVEAGNAMLSQAHKWLFKKQDNPVAAAAGAYMLLSHSEGANNTLDRGWRKWVRNLYKRFPAVPDGAIAMAQLELDYGEVRRDADIDVERLRGYALEAVARGVPYLSTGVRRLTDVLIALEGDDQVRQREGSAVEATRSALSLVRQLGRITAPGEVFTVLLLNGVRS